MEPRDSLLHSNVPATCQSLPIPFFILGISQLGHKTRPGHCNVQHWKFRNDWSCMCVYWCLVFLTALYFRVAYCPQLHILYSIHTCALCSWESHMGLRNIRHMCEQSTNSESGAVICHAKCIIPSFLNFFQFGENIHWIIDGFALGTMCARCVDIDHFCAKAPWA